MDGHSGLENRQLNEGGSGSFRLVLALLKDRARSAHFIIHATSNIYPSGPGLPPIPYLQGIGMQFFEGECQFFRDRCCWRHFADFHDDGFALGQIGDTEMIHNAFKRFASNLEDLYALHVQSVNILRTIAAEAPSLPVFSQAPPTIVVKPSDVPRWVDAVKFTALRDLETKRQAIDSEIQGLSQYLPLLFGSGEVLESAVLIGLQALGLSARKAPAGFTADILAASSDGSRRFGFEVTGINGALKKDSGKLTQLLDFERLKEHEEKTVLLANTHNTKPIQERRTLEHFTGPVVEFLSRHPILMMTGWDLYRLVGDVVEGRRRQEDVIQILHELEGVLTL